MPHRTLIPGLLLVLLLSAVGTQAQLEDFIDDSQPLQASHIQSVLLERTESNDLFLTVEWMSTNCLDANFETQVTNNVISVQVSNPAQLDGLACDAPASGEEDIQLGDDFQNDESYAIIVNDFTAEVYLPRPGGTLLDHPTQLAPVGETELIETPRNIATIENIAVTITDDNTLAFSLEGTYASGCEIPAYARIVPNLADETRHNLEVFRFVSPLIDCPAQLIRYEMTLESDLTPDEVQFVAAERALYEWSPDSGELVFVEALEGEEDMPDEQNGNNRRVFTVIDSVEVAVLESFPMQLSLTVRGSQPDGCDVPVQVEQQVEGNTVTISIYRELPMDIMCPMVVIPYEETLMVDGSFEGGTVEIQVNEFTTSVDLE
jgi:inhibitor of cysteine peptidase